MEYLFAHWPRIAEKLRKSQSIFVLLDYDGTLTPLRGRPELALFPEEMRGLLKVLALHPRINLGIISGRALPELKKLVKIQGIVYAGNHGFEIELPRYRSKESSRPGLRPRSNSNVSQILFEQGRALRYRSAQAPRGRVEKRFVHPAAVKAKPLIRKIYRQLQDTVSHIKGVVIENKTFTLSVHYRLVTPSRVASLKREVKGIIRPFVCTGSVFLSSGKKVFEIKPAIDWDKGKAALWIMKKETDKQVLPIYIGDDRTDEDAFRVLKRRGVSICVGRKRSSQAKYFLKDVSETEKFLGILAYNL